MQQIWTPVLIGIVLFTAPPIILHYTMSPVERARRDFFLCVDKAGSRSAEIIAQCEATAQRINGGQQ